MAEAQSAGNRRMAPRYEPSLNENRLTGEIITAAIEVHRLLGPGFLESIYENAMQVEMQLREIKFRRQLPIMIQYKGTSIGEHRLDLLVDERIVVELKAIEALAPIHRAQVISYLRATKLHLGLVINFNVPLLKNGIQRVIVS